MYGAFGMPTPDQLRALINQVWTGNAGDEHARLVVADAYDEIGRTDVAALWRDALPGYRRRKRVPAFTTDEQAEIGKRRRWWYQNVVERIGPSDEHLALAAIAALYRANYADDPQPLPRVTWAPTPLLAAEWSRYASGETGRGLVYPWIMGLSDKITQSTSQTMYNARPDPEYAYNVDYAALQETGETVGLVSGLNYGQFGRVAAEFGIFLDILRLDIPARNELHCRAGIALAQVTPYYYATERAIWLSQHPFTIDQHYPRWAWIDNDNRPHQWPAL